MENQSSPNVFNSIQKQYPSSATSIFWNGYDFLYSLITYISGKLILEKDGFSLKKSLNTWVEKSIDFLLSPFFSMRSLFKSSDLIGLRNDTFHFNILYHKKFILGNDPFNTANLFDFKQHG